MMDLFYVGSFTYLACADRLTGSLILYHIKPGQAVPSRLISISREIFQAYGVPAELSTDSGLPFSAYLIYRRIPNAAIGLVHFARMDLLNILE